MFDTEKVKTLFNVFSGLYASLRVVCLVTFYPIINLSLISIFSDPVHRVRLVASCASGTSKMFTMILTANGWVNDEKRTVNVEAMEAPLSGCSYVLDSRSGIMCAATKLNLAKTVEPASVTRATKEDPRSCLWISVGRKGCKCVLNFTGHRIAKIDWGKDKMVDCVNVVTRKGGDSTSCFTPLKWLLTSSRGIGSRCGDGVARDSGVFLTIFVAVAPT